MAKAPIVSLADVLVDLLNAATFSQEFTATRRYYPHTKLEEADGLVVSVVPAAVERVPGTRAGPAIIASIDAAVQKSVIDENDNATIDPLMLLVDEIVTEYHNETPAAGAIVTASTNDPIYIPEHLRDLHLFTSVIRFTFRDAR
jgi:hypothetical protein